MSERLSPGDPAPDFTLPDADGKPVSLADYRGRRVVVYFYPAAMTPGCTKEACDFRDNLAVAGRRRLSTWSASPRTSRRSWPSSADAEQLTFPLLSDPSRAVLEAYGAYGEKKLYGKKVDGVIRSTFVVDADGQDRAGPVQRQGHRPRRRPAQEAVRLGHRRRAAGGRWGPCHRHTAAVPDPHTPSSVRRRIGARADGQARRLGEAGVA